MNNFNNINLEDLLSFIENEKLINNQISTDELIQKIYDKYGILLNEYRLDSVDEIIFKLKNLIPNYIFEESIENDLNL